MNDIMIDRKETTETLREHFRRPLKTNWRSSCARRLAANFRAWNILQQLFHVSYLIDDQAPADLASAREINPCGAFRGNCDRRPSKRSGALIAPDASTRFEYDDRHLL